MESSSHQETRLLGISRYMRKTIRCRLDLALSTTRLPAIGPEAQEHISATETIRALRAALNTLGDGFVEAIDDRTLIAIAEGQPELSDGRVHGEVVQAPIFEAPGQTRVGRFGWKDQHSSLLSFIGDAYLNEM